jgi:hypothetical protein
MPYSPVLILLEYDAMILYGWALDRRGGRVGWLMIVRIRRTTSRNQSRVRELNTFQFRR